MPLDRAAIIGCAVITGLGSVMRTTKVEPGASVAVIGCGGVGLNCINGAHIAGAGRIIAIDTQEAKLDLAKTFGATDVVNAKEGNPVKAVKEMTKGGVHYSFEAIGLKATVEQAFYMLRPGGTATIIGMVPAGTYVEIHGADFLRERKLQGSFMGSNQSRTDLPRLVEYYMQGRLKLDEMITDRIKLTQINAAFDNLRANKGSVARQVVIFDI